MNDSYETWTTSDGCNPFTGESGDYVPGCDVCNENSENSSDDQEGSGSVNYVDSQITGYDADGNPIIGGTAPQVVTVSLNGDTLTVTFNSPSCPSGKVLLDDGSCDIPIYGWMGSGKEVLISVAANSAAIANPCVVASFYGLSALPGGLGAFGGDVYMWLSNAATIDKPITLLTNAAARNGIGKLTAIARSGPALTATATALKPVATAVTQGISSGCSKVR